MAQVVYNKNVLERLDDQILNQAEGYAKKSLRLSAAVTGLTLGLTVLGAYPELTQIAWPLSISFSALSLTGNHIVNRLRKTEYAAKQNH